MSQTQQMRMSCSLKRLRRAKARGGGAFIGAASRRASQQRGFGLVEVLISALMVAVIAVAVATALVAAADQAGSQRARSQASSLAQLDQERMRGLSAQQLTDLAPPNQQTRTVTLSGIPYTITSSAQFLNSTGGSACGSTGAGAAAYYEVTTTVTWPNAPGGAPVTTPVVMQSQISPSTGGTLLVETEDQTGAPLPGVAVTATGAGSAAGTTDTQGCAIFAGLPTGDYTLALTDPGYVNDNDVAANPLNISSTVTSTGTATPSGGNPIRLGLAGTFNANFWGASAAGQTPTTSGAYTGQQADAVSWYGTGSSDSMSSYLCQLYAGSTCPASSSTAQTPGTTIPSTGTLKLYPFAYLGPPVSYTNNYHVWAGPCRQEEPPAGIDAFSVSPGSSQSFAVQEPAASLAVDYNGTQILPADLMIKFTSSSGTTCSDKWSTPVNPSAATAGANALADPGQPFASTATSGSTESASTQTGTLSVCADYSVSSHSGSTSYYATESGLQNNNFSGVTAWPALNITSTTGTCASKF
jgi:Tfp pilus assembly protein PilV